MTLRNLLAVLALATGCATSPEPTPAAAPAAAPTGDLLGIHEMTFFERDQPQMHIAANGNLEMRMVHFHDQVRTVDNKFIGTLAADGTITNAAKDKVAHLAADGTLTGPDGKVAPFKLVGETLIVDAKTFTIDAKGMVAKNGTPVDPPLRVEGATDALARRTALLALGFVLGVNEPTVTTQEAGATVPPTK
jgi:hypothetical protein